MKEKVSINEKTITALEARGAKRWTKAGKDRLYLNEAAYDIVGLEIERYKTGNISYAALDGEKISHTSGAEIVSMLESMYIDIPAAELITPARVRHYQYIPHDIADYISSLTEQE